VALDSDATRLQRVHENLARGQIQAEVICADASDLAGWWDNRLFDRVLLDAPCSATGVIRRHPDIKWLRRASDIDNLVSLQANLLEQLWQVVKPGGTLLYATCSILPAENDLQIKQFVAKHKDVCTLSLQQQFLPQPQGGDGFFYAKLEKAQ